MNIILVFIGGGLGSILRYLTSFLFSNIKFAQVPIGTLSVNVVASLILGICFALFQSKINLSPSLKLAITCGFCGGLSTFSTFAFESLQLIEMGSILQALLYALMNVFLCVLAVYLGTLLGKNF